MPVLLTTAFDPGDLDLGNTYPRAKIVRFDVELEQKTINVRLQYGDVVNGKWVRGSASPTKHFAVYNSLDPVSTDYDDMVSEAALETEQYVIYSGAKRVIYQWLIDKGELVGTIE